MGSASGVLLTRQSTRATRRARPTRARRRPAPPPRRCTCRRSPRSCSSCFRVPKRDKGGARWHEEGRRHRDVGRPEQRASRIRECPEECTQAHVNEGILYLPGLLLPLLARLPKCFLMGPNLPVKALARTDDSDSSTAGPGSSLRLQVQLDKLNLSPLNLNGPAGSLSVHTP